MTTTVSRPKALLTVGPESRLVAPLAAGLGARRMFHSFGEEIPDLAGFDVSVWCAGIWAARLQRVELARDVCSPGAAWLPGVDAGLLGRTVVNGSVAAMCAAVGPDEMVWVKPAEAKIPAFVAGLYTPSRVAELLAAEDVDAAVELQWTRDVLTFDFEHRFFVADGQIVTGSPYRVGEVLGYWPGISWSRFGEAARFAADALRVFAADDMLPPHFTLDVGFDTLRERWVVIEGNRSWSSGVYGCDPTLALVSIDAATHYGDARWRWMPDLAVAARAAAMPLMRVLPVDDTHAVGFVEYQG